MDTNFGTIVCNRMLLNAAKFQGYSFYRFRVIKGKPTVGGGAKITPPAYFQAHSIPVELPQKKHLMYPSMHFEVTEEEPFSCAEE